MLKIPKYLDKFLTKYIERHVVSCYSTSSKVDKTEEFRVLNIRNVKGQGPQRRAPRKSEAIRPRTEQMPVDQDWGNVWPGPRSFHPATVPLPIRQGYVKKAGPPPQKYANAELMKIPNFLHLTPPVIKRQCEALKQFCTPWPQGLETEEKCFEHFPIEVVSSDYCHSSPSIRDPLARIVSIRFKLSALDLNKRAKDKFLRLVGERYNEENDTVTIVADRCPLKKQNYDYALYLLTACYHESWNREPWEDLKSEADMEYYDWYKNKSKESVETIFGKPFNEIEHIEDYSKAVTTLMNEGESEYTVKNYGNSVRKLLGIPNLVD